MLGGRIRFDDHPTRAVFDTVELPTNGSYALYRVYLRSWQRHSCRPESEDTPMFDAICPKGWCRWMVHMNILNYLDGIGRLGWPKTGGVVWQHRTIDPYACQLSAGSRIPMVDFRADASSLAKTK